MCDNSRECQAAADRGFSAPNTHRALDDAPDATPTGPAPATVRPGWRRRPGGGRLVAVPAALEGGLDAERSPHFGRAPAFVLVEIVAGGIGSARVLVNPPHEIVGHGYAANTLASEGVTEVVTSGIGEGMRSRIEGAGIVIWHETQATTVRGAIDALLGGGVRLLGDDDVHAPSGRGH